MSNITNLKRGASGTVLTATLSDEDGAFNLTGMTVAIYVFQGSATPVINGAACTVVTAAEGTISFAFDATTSDLTPGEYRIEFVATDGSGKKYIFPSDRTRPYGRLIVKDSAIA